MKKVFYSVKYNEFGFDRTLEMWFDNLEEAKRFANHDYRDNPIKHVYTSAKTIEMVEHLIKLQEN